MGKHIFFFRESDPYTGIFSQWYLMKFQARTCLPPIPDPNTKVDVDAPAPDPSSFPVVTFNCTEQYMMYHKALLAHDDFAAMEILKASAPRKQKALGRAIPTLDLDEWDRVKFRVVCEGNYAKFTAEGKEGKELREGLLNTGEKKLAEASPYDAIWGIGHKAEDARFISEDKWRGTNLLGKAIVRVRERIKMEAEGKEVPEDWTAGGDA